MKVNLQRYQVKEVDGVLKAQPPADQPDFTIFTAPMTAGNQPMIVNMVGSSSEQDLQGDIMDLKALNMMTQVQPGLAIWLNHDYTLPGSLFGSLAASPRIIQQNGVADLELSVEVEPDSPDAMQTYAYIKRGKVRLGCSIGCKVLSYELVDDGLDPNDPYAAMFAPMRILAVQTLEWSVVGIPANQRSWVENAARGVFQRTLDPRLAPAVKSMFPRDYEKIVASVEDKDQREELAAMPARPTPTRRLGWKPDSRTFFVKDQHGERPLVSSAVEGLVHATKSEYAAQVETEIDEVKGASGKSSWPLTDRDVAWDNGEATQAIEKWADGNASKLASVHFWKDSSADGSLIGSYKLLFCDVIGGDVKAVPKGIFACAAAMEGSHGNKPDIDDADGVRSKIAGWYKKMAEEFKDPTIVAPWEDDKKADEPEKQAAEEIEPAAESVEEPAAEVEVEVPAVEEKAAEEVEVPALPAVDPVKAWMLETYNSLGLQLGFKAVDLTKAAAPADDEADDAPKAKSLDAGQIGSLALQIDDLSDTLAMQADQLLDAMGLQDDDSDDVQAAEDKAESESKKDVNQALNLLKMFTVVKAGARHSAEDMKSLQAIHDAVVALTGGMVCAVPSDGDEDGEADTDDQEDSPINGTAAAIVPLTAEIQLLRESFGHINVKALEVEVGTAMAKLAEVSAALETKKAELDAATKLASQAKADALKAAALARDANATVKKLTEMPLGRPTGHAGRKIKADEGTVTFSEMLKLAEPADEVEEGETLASALKQTTVSYVVGVGKVRHWPDGVGKSVRPRLTNDQKIIMPPADISAYLEGGEADVPVIDAAD